MKPSLHRFGAALLRDLRLALRRRTYRLHPVALPGVAREGEQPLVREARTFELRSSDAVLPGGFVEIDLSIVAGDSADSAAALLVDAGGGFEERNPIHLPAAAAGRIEALIHLPEQVRGIRLRLTGGPGLEPGDLRAREVTRAEAAARLGGPLILRRLAGPRDIPAAATKLVRTLRDAGPRGVLDHLLQKATSTPPVILYSDWRRQHQELSDADRAALRARAATAAARPLFSVLLPVYDPPEPWLVRAIESVRRQLYDRWELCIADDASTASHVQRVLQAAAAGDPRVRWVRRAENGHISAASNTALGLATGDFVVLLDHDDELGEDALALLALELERHPDADLLYSDEDKIDAAGRLQDPFFKPDWNPDLLLSQNYIAHLCALRRSLVTGIGGFREGFEGSQDHDLVLRASAKARAIRHLPFVLYHWRAIPGSTARETAAKPYAGEAGRRAVQERVGDAARVEPGPFPATYRLRWRIPEPAPLISLLIPTRDHRDVLETCIESILSRTSWRHFEIVVVDNQSSDPETLAYLVALERRGAARVLRYDAPFNFSAINNFASRHARGGVLGLLNNDLEAVDGGWLEEMVSQALRPEIGAVGARLLYPDGTLQHGGVVLGIGGVAGHGHKYAPSDAPGYFSRARLVHDVSAVTAACLLIRKETYQRVGGFDESLAVAFNDVDFCLRVRALGLRNLWTPFATLIHHESRTRGAEDTRNKRARFRAETERMVARWGDALGNDPAYNPNLTLEREDFSLAWPPRVRKPWH